MGQIVDIRATFHLVADVKFKALNIDEALKKLADHFAALASNQFDVPSIFEAGSTMNLEPLNEEDKNAG